MEHRTDRKAEAFTIPNGNKSSVNELLNSNVKVVNVGLEGFVKDLQDCNVTVVSVDWAPPAGGDPEMAALLAKLGV